MEQAESNPDSLRVFTTERWFVQSGMAARGIACCSSAAKTGCSGGKVMANELTLSVNGAKQVVSAAPETPLLFVLRNELKLTGPRLGCGMAQCGACSVLLDGEEVRERGRCSQHAAPDPAGMDRRTSAAMRLLPKRYDDRRGAVARQEPESNGGSNQGCFHQHPAVTPPVPLRHLLRHHRCRETRRHRDARGKAGASMTPGIEASSELPVASVTILTPAPITRRGFVKMGGALFVSLSIPAGLSLHAAESPTSLD